MLIEIIGSESLCKIARRLIRDGADPNGHVTWTRKGTPVFARTNPLSVWAGHRVAEHDTRSVSMVRHKRFPRDTVRPETAVTA